MAVRCSLCYATAQCVNEPMWTITVNRTEDQPVNICRPSQRRQNGQILKARHQRQGRLQTIEITASDRVASQLQRLTFFYKPAAVLMTERPCASHESILTWAFDRDKWSLHGRFTSGKQTLLSIEWQARWAPELVWRLWGWLVVCADSRTMIPSGVQSVVLSLYQLSYPVSAHVFLLW